MEFLKPEVVGINLYDMRTSTFLISCFLPLVSICLLSCNPKEKTPNQSISSSPILLEELSPEVTGVHFQNTIDEKGRINIFTWHSLYNGGGVGIADFNQDGLPDIYFTATMSPDKIYLNKGNFTFEDITGTSGIDQSIYSTGVTIVDINADGLPDIYVCKSSPTVIHENNRNRLYINKGNGKFSEEGNQYGLGDIGFSVHAVFFDLDQDNDLDVYLVNQPFDEFARLVNKPEAVASYPQTDRLYINNNGKFEDKTAQMGLEEGRYGLSVSLSDVDLNGWPDLYVCNDYFHPDRLLMNHSGILSDELERRIGHISFYSMGSDAGDINNDGWPDLVTMDMAFEDHVRSKTNMGSMDIDKFWRLVNEGNYYQYMHNALQLNNGNGQFSEIAQLCGVAKTDWSYAALFADLNSDGWSDLLVTNGIVRDMQNNDFNQMVKNKYNSAVGPNNYLEILNELPSVPVSNLIYQNEGNLKFQKLGKEAGFSKPGFSHGMAYADLDGDGDLDIVINSINAPASIYKNNTKRSGNSLTVKLEGTASNPDGLGTSVIVCANGMKQIKTMTTTRGYLSSVQPLLHFGLGNATEIDSIVVIWNHKYTSTLHNLPANQKLVINYNKTQKVAFQPNNPNQTEWGVLNESLFTHLETDFNDFEKQVLLPYKLSQDGPNITVGDINNDGLDDFFIGGGANQPAGIFIQESSGKFVRTTQPDLIRDRIYEDRKGIFLDVDNDNDIDLLITSGSNELEENSEATQLRLYLNNNGIFQRAGASILPDIRVNASTAVAFDLEGDGDDDLFIGGRLVSGQYTRPPKSYILRNDGGKFFDVTSQTLPALSNLGMVTDAKLVGHEIWICGEWMYPHRIILSGNGNLNLVPVEEAGVGLWWTVSAADVDNDGDMDMLLGNLGLNNKFGGQKETPLEIYAGDLDENGDFDVVLAVEKKDKVLPVRGRECSSQEMPFILDKFPDYASYANADLYEIYPSSALQNSLHKKITNMASCLMINEGSKWKRHKLPIQCQTGPIKAFMPGDFNKDGNIDFMFTGNHYPAEVETARYDGLFTGVAYGSGNGEFVIETMPQIKRGDYRDIQPINDPQGNSRYLLAENNGPLQIITPPYHKLAK